MIRVVVVEDQKEIREIQVRRINASPDLLCLDSFERGEEAVPGIIASRPDVVLMDIGLPGMSGIEAMVRIRQECPNIEFVMFTVFMEDGKIFDALQAGASGYVLKNDSHLDILDAIREVQHGGSPMTMEIARKVLKSFRPEKQRNSLIEKLSDRETEVLELLSKGLLYKEIAQALIPAVTVGTVRQTIHRIYKKLQVNNAVEAVNKYLGRKN
ncbi:MAG: response regulator transcription factor [Saprospiraceae bacterium]|nr:response regulator transcription factor [Saprospiraceae bacterium]